MIYGYQGISSRTEIYTSTQEKQNMHHIKLPLRRMSEQYELWLLHHIHILQYIKKTTQFY